MKNFIFISPNFPNCFYKFLKELKKRDFRVLSIGDCPWYELSDDVKRFSDEYYYLPSLADEDEMIKAVEFYKEKYGEIEYLESNNEFWLMQDAKLREICNVKHGLRPSDMTPIKFKSEMKANFEKAGVKVARYVLPNSLEDGLNFAKLVGYPLFVKPNNGVGASDSYAIHNEDELKTFFEKEHYSSFIMEEFIEGEIVTFDGIADDDSNVVLCFNEVFPIPVADVVNDDLDDYYYCSYKMDKEFEEMGRRVVKAFGIKKRCFHIEFFKLSSPRPGLADLGEIVALEVNMRPPGGNTPDILSESLGASFYAIYADVMAYNEVRTSIPEHHNIAISVSKKDRFNYVHNHEEIMEKYGPNIFDYGRYNKEIALCMGNAYYNAKFNTTREALEFVSFLRSKKAE